MHYSVRAPGRICLFGEHQDYLGYPVIAAAIDKYIFIDGISNQNQSLDFVFKDLNTTKSISLPNHVEDIEYRNQRDYLLSGLKVFIQNYGCFTQGWDLALSGNIPINAGASSSSAMVIAWLKFLSVTNGIELDPRELGTLGYQAEVAEFGEAGGMMDHFASAFGKIIYVSSKLASGKPEFHAENLNNSLSGLILVNSGIKKNTVDDLRRVKTTALSAFSKIRTYLPNFDINTTSIQEVESKVNNLNQTEQEILLGNLDNRDITQQAKLLLNSSNFNQQELGNLIYQHHVNLSSKIHVSIPQIDHLVDISIDAGAYGAKINGSGFGGTMFAYAPKNTEEVMEAIKNEGYNPILIGISDGARSLE